MGLEEEGCGSKEEAIRLLNVLAALVAVLDTAGFANGLAVVDGEGENGEAGGVNWKELVEPAPNPPKALKFGRES